MPRWRGEWNAATAAAGGYTYGDQLDFNGGQWECLVTGTTAQPGADATWLNIGGSNVSPPSVQPPAGTARGTIIGNGVTVSFPVTHNLALPTPFTCVPRFFLTSGTDSEVVPGLGSFTLNGLVATFITPPASGQTINWVVTV